MQKEYNKNSAFLFDYAVLVLDTEKNLEEYFGSFGYDFLQKEYQFKQTVKNMRIIGYPKSKMPKMVEYKG